MSHLSGRDNVRWVALDLCDPYKRFAQEHFPKAGLVADKSQVLRLLQGPLMKYRKTRRRRRQQWLPETAIAQAQALHPATLVQGPRGMVAPSPDAPGALRGEEALHSFYRIRSLKQAKRVLMKLCDTLAYSPLPELQRLRRTLMKWRKPILNYWPSRLTNARTEGFNNKAKLEGLELRREARSADGQPEAFGKRKSPARWLGFCAPRRIRTYDLRIRSPLLYPAELEARFN